ncbi:transglycosylase SLT domain-containing protein [Porphyrobacter algicida]|uniref:Transglycosylase SLT domain-containing protein n=2 Tax=Qipengyuania algicida TaxID=1836209 RepID=A0A845AJR7_9SPHN|nr:transglycosylase SLT domain-containing protein [Qipengyuania algicida]
MASAIARWEQLVASSSLSFNDYASFITQYPGFPRQETLQRRAEAALDSEAPSPQTLVAFFDKFPPLTNSARARYALALGTLARPGAASVARDAWRGGTMSGPSEAYVLGLYGQQFTQQDQDARMNALLWQGDTVGAARQIARVSPDKRATFMARLSLAQGQDPAANGLIVPADATSDPGYIYNLARYDRSSGNLSDAVTLLATRPKFASLPLDPQALVGEMLRVARGAGDAQAVQIAAKVDELFAPGADLTQQPYRLRDDYTSLMWLGGTKALWNLGDGARAAPLFYRYGAAAQTTQTRSKGFYWAGIAAQRAGDRAAATKYLAMAADYPERFYGQLALKQLGHPMPSLANNDPVIPSPQQTAAFNAAPLTKAVREVARDAPWKTGIQFYKAIAENASTPEQMALVSTLARQIGRRDLAVILADQAGSQGFDEFVAQGYPVVDIPPGANWTMVHAIARQESQFADNAISHAGARGLMQLMPRTAQEQAGKLGITYLSADLIRSPSTNLQLGDAYFARMMDYYGGSYPLAVAAYNAGPGNVNKWLAANGDPRTGSVPWVKWIEEIPIYETKNYVQRVIENAADYEQLYPGKLNGRSPRTVSDFLR